MLLVLFSFTSSILPSRVQALEPVVMDDARGEYQLGPFLEYYEDKSAKLTIQDVSSPEYDGKFIRVKKQSMNFGQTRSAIWMRFRVENKSSEKSFYLKSMCPFIWDIKLFLHSNKTWEMKRAGFARPFKDRDIENRNVVFIIPAEQNDTKVIYLRFATPTPLIISLNFFS